MHMNMSYYGIVRRNDLSENAARHTTKITYTHCVNGNSPTFALEILPKTKGEATKILIRRKRKTGRMKQEIGNSFFSLSLCLFLFLSHSRSHLSQTKNFQQNLIQMYRVQKYCIDFSG